MKKQTILSSILGIVLLALTACSNNDENAIENGKVDVAQRIEFKVNFADYNTEQSVNVTRAPKEDIKLAKSDIDLGNGIVAECTLQRDTVKQEHAPRTRALYSTFAYTMLAFDASTHAYKGSVTGSVTYSGGNWDFTPTSSNESISLTPGTYDFVLYNDKVTRSGNNLTVTQANAADAWIGRTTQVITATPRKQKVAFTMKHAGAVVKIRLEGYGEFDMANTTGVLSSINSTAIPSSAVYDAANDSWTMGTGTAVSSNTTFSSTLGEMDPWASNTLVYRAISSEIAFLPSTDVSKLKFTFTNGKYYNLNLAGAGLIFNPASPLKLDKNGSYILNIKLKKNFIYLMSDGTRGFFKDTTYGGGTKTPIAVVVSRSKHLAIALTDANNGNPCDWCSTGSTYTSTPYNKSAVGKNTFDQTSLYNGYSETWDASASTDNVTVKGTSSDFPAFKAAAEYTPTLPAGVQLTGKMVGKKWFLPSLGEWKLACFELGGNDDSSGMQNYQTGIGHLQGYYSWWYDLLATEAFTQVGGTSFTEDPRVSQPVSDYYWSSSESSENGSFYYPCTIYGVLHGFRWYWAGYNGNTTGSTLLHVRPFIHYDE
ncbi:fimbrillin family protein [Prevotella melaninogenica]|uniref:fimbrillin family protein n=1 Tax=Prevotella melaninogenica TaxID=28132 RepID=UPI001BA9B27C|nr:fimbrillin family protein [Prevotella melaninogenica]QUB60323.1 fimbrillin family protein [Prevotella melaninogenica]